MAKQRASIQSITLNHATDPERRSITVLARPAPFSGEPVTVTIEPCYEGWEQFGAGATNEMLWQTKHVADHYSGWLHGKKQPAALLDEQ